MCPNQEKRHPERSACFSLNGSPGRTRTSDKVVNSHLLYRLSYRGIGGERYEPPAIVSTKHFPARLSAPSRTKQGEWTSALASGVGDCQYIVFIRSYMFYMP